MRELKDNPHQWASLIAIRVMSTSDPEAFQLNHNRYDAEWRRLISLTFGHADVIFGTCVALPKLTTLDCLKIIGIINDEAGRTPELLLSLVTLFPIAQLQFMVGDPDQCPSQVLSRDTHCAENEEDKFLAPSTLCPNL